MDQACQKCGKVYADIQKCPTCGSILTRDWSGKAALIDPEKSKIAKEMKTPMKGLYAIKL